MGISRSSSAGGVCSIVNTFTCRGFSGMISISPSNVRSLPVELRLVFRRESNVSDPGSVSADVRRHSGKQRARKSPDSCARAPHGHLLQSADWLFNTPVTKRPASRPFLLDDGGRRQPHWSPLQFRARFGAENSRRFHEAGLALGCRF